MTNAKSVKNGKGERRTTLSDRGPRPKYKICVSGAAETGHCAQDALEKSEQVGRLIAKYGMVLVTGATTGTPYWAAKGAKEAGGIVIGLSPASSEAEHLKKYHLPVDYHDLIIYTGFEYSGRNLLLTRSSDAVITLCGRMGTLNEFTIAFEDDKPIGVLEGSGGITNELRHLLDIAKRGPGKVVFDRDPEQLLLKVVQMIEKEKENSYA
ncbi:MAG: LOG family protein [Candidatus Liptonbacteria bacterium]|nr:LOG family protein [Candidatus Liptonbacteria bacterium]